MITHEKTERDTEQVLKRYGALIKLMKEQEEEIQDLIAQRHALLDGLLRAPRLAGDWVQENRRNDPVYDTVEKMIDVYDERLRAAAQRLGDLNSQYVDLKGRLDRAEFAETERQYIDLRYVRGLKQSDAAEQMNYSESQIKRIQRRIRRTAI